jgi:hypothetical protein
MMWVLTELLPPERLECQWPDTYYFTQKVDKIAALNTPSPYESRQNEIMLQLNISMKLVSRNLFR